MLGCLGTACMEEEAQGDSPLSRPLARRMGLGVVEQGGGGWNLCVTQHTSY